SGAQRWSRAFSGVLERAMLLRTDRFLYLGSTFTGTIDLGTGPLTSAGDRDFVIAAIDDNHTTVWAERFGGSYEDVLEALALAPDGTVYATGSFSDEIDVGGTPLSTNGIGDMFVIALSPVLAPAN